MISEASPLRTGDEPVQEAVATIEEMVRDLGEQAVVAAIYASTIYLRVVGTTDATQRIGQVIIRQIAYAENPRLEAEIIALATGIILFDDFGCRATARKHGLTPAAISKRVIAFADAHNLPPSQYMRSLKDRDTYSKTNRPRTK